MVNVAGRSKGCTPCRRRRIKCDEHRPTCLRCQKSRLECDGPRDLIILEDRIPSKPASGRARVISQPTANRVTPSPSSLSPAIDDYEASLCYATKYIKSGGPIELAQRNIRPSDIVALQADPSTTPLFTTAYLSLALLWNGQQNHQRSVFDKGLAMHSLTLRKLHGALLNRVTCISDEVLLSVATLALLETRIPTRNSSYMQHIMGLQQLMQLRDPAKHRSQAARDFYMHIRHMLIYGSIRTRQSTVLARADWKALLRSHCSAEELWEQDLFEILADCSCLFARRQQLAAAVPRDRDGLAQLTEESRALLHRLRRWRSLWDQEGQYSHLDDSSSLEGLQSALKLSAAGFAARFPIRAFHFVSPAAAALLLQYDATVMSVSRLLLSLQDLGEEVPPNPLLPDGNNSLQAYAARHQEEYSPKELFAALEICCCIPYIISRDAHQFCSGSPNIHWAITTAWMMLGRDTSPIGQWITETLDMKHAGHIAKGLWESKSEEEDITSTSEAPVASRRISRDASGQ